MPNAFRAALIAAVSLGAAATSSPAGAAELGPIDISIFGAYQIQISNSSSSWYVYDFDIGNSSPGGANLSPWTTQPDWQATAQTFLVGSNILTLADYLSLGDLSDDIGPGQTSSNFYYSSNPAAVINYYSVSLVNSTGQLMDYSVSGVPESSTWAMILLGFVGLGFAGFRANVSPSGLG